jgi:tRNA nucleotidyltransferase (CCA-adding enzyme)
MNHSLTKALQCILDEATRAGQRIFLVGGVVRDRVLGLPVQGNDYDLCLEGDALGFAEAIQPLLQGSLKRYPNFRSATISTEHAHFDFVSARTETYPHPGALPVVTWATIEQDLPRRDFTINAIAMSLGDFLSGAPQYIDVTGGLADLAKQSVAIIHSQSFRDDPTRLFRAVRYATRLSFSLSEATKVACSEALAADVLCTISTKRTITELQKILDEPCWHAMLRALDGLAIRLPLFPQLQFESLIEPLRTASDRSTTLLQLLCRELPRVEAKKFLQELSLPRELRDQIVGA